MALHFNSISATADSFLQISSICNSSSSTHTQSSWNCSCYPVTFLCDLFWSVYTHTCFCPSSFSPSVPSLLSSAHLSFLGCWAGWVHWHCLQFPSLFPIQSSCLVLVLGHTNMYIPNSHPPPQKDDSYLYSILSD